MALPGSPCLPQKEGSALFILDNGWRKFNTNGTQVYYGKAAIEFRSSDLFPNGFFIYFQNTGSFPNLDSILIDSSGRPLTVTFSITYNDTGYSSFYRTQAYLYQSKVNGRTQFELKGHWLYHSYRPDEDSVWAKGTFVVPKY